MSDAPLLTATGLTKTFSGIMAVENVNTTVVEGNESDSSVPTEQARRRCSTACSASSNSIKGSSRWTAST